jgi:hypothetical protein
MLNPSRGQKEQTMGPFTPQTQDSTVYQLAAQLMADATNDGDRARIDRALDLVATVERLPSGQWSVPSSTGQGGYVVSRDARTCDCHDYTRRETACKHIFSVRLAQQVERADAEAADPTITIRVDPEDSILDLWPTDGEPCDIHPIGTITVLPMADHLRALRDELFGQGV